MYTLLRIEHKDDGLGPYQLVDWRDGSRKIRTSEPIPVNHTDFSHPSWYTDGFTCSDYYHLAGFCSYEQLIAWFNRDELQWLHDAGYVVAFYTISIIDFVSDRQCVFDSRIAKRIDTMTIL